MDYGLGLEKPVLYIDVPAKARNDWWPELDMEPFESLVREEIGGVVSPDSLELVPDRIRELLQEPDAFRENIKAVRQAWVYNLGDSARAGAEAIVQLASGVDDDSVEADAAAGETSR